MQSGGDPTCDKRCCSDDLLSHEKRHSMECADTQVNATQAPLATRSLDPIHTARSSFTASS